MRAIAIPVNALQFRAILRNSAKLRAIRQQLRKIPQSVAQFCTVAHNSAQLRAIPHSCTQFPTVARNCAERKCDWKPYFRCRDNVGNFNIRVKVKKLRQGSEAGSEREGRDEYSRSKEPSSVGVPPQEEEEEEEEEIELNWQQKVSDTIIKISQP